MGVSSSCEEEPNDALPASKQNSGGETGAVDQTEKGGHRLEEDEDEDEDEHEHVEE